MTEQLAKPPTPSERADNARQIQRMHPGNRFRLMRGLPLLPDHNETTEEMKTEPLNPPIEGMKTMPYGLPLMLEAWAGLVSFASRQPEACAAFKKETGLDLEALAAVHPFAQIIDEASGYQKMVVAAFADWVTETLWREEGKVA